MDALKEFWALVQDVWVQGVLGVDVGSLLIAGFILLAFIALRGPLSRFVLVRIETWAGKTETQFDDALVRALAPPLRFVPVILGVFFALNFLKLPENALFYVDQIIKTLIAFTLFWVMFRAVEPLSYVIEKLERIFTREIIDWLVKAVKVLVCFLGAAVILEIWGIKVGPLLAGLGLVGVAVALGAQDLFKNLISGILILAEKRFAVGNWIKVDGVVEGTVEQIGFRSTLIRRFDRAPVYVPNAKLSDQVVTNFSRMTHRRIYWLISVEYRTSIAQLRRIRDSIESYILNSGDFADPLEVATFVRIDSFNDSSIDIMLYCFTKTTVWGEWLEIKEKLAYEVKRIVEEAGAGFALPSRSLYLETLPDVAPEGDKPEHFMPEGSALPVAGE